ncbi:hypothetical protein BUALT_Bualt01G0036000 [Buddleja alternifolia]|uniref:Retrovirus-related Pol polyprotein from transposon TNT 1-94-like beta-barrel domain-containing protein n=1 Tax=Buddleja alternifolia TaxID=168488 RepID=A0AAV6YA72_9LAMI|nr:hypothetical protein BUALT_Bualt01G0036000 [Buddleja alternifolia]
MAHYAQEDDDDNGNHALLMVTTASETANHHTWFLDTGCTNHICGKKELFVDLDDSVHSKVRFADDSTISVMGKGRILIKLKNGDHKYISDVFYVPEIKYNLLSMGQLIEKGYDFNSCDNQLFICDKREEVSQIPIVNEEVPASQVPVVNEEIPPNDAQDVPQVERPRRRHQQSVTLRDFETMMAGMDRISELPEPILQDIVFLLPWEDASHMCVLSKRFKDLWKILPVFNFNFEQKLDEGKFLRGRERKIYIQKGSKDLISVVDQAFLDFRSEKGLIQKFRLRIEILRSLKVVSLFRVCLDGEFVDSFFAGSLVLRDFALEECLGFERINVVGTNLESFLYEGHYKIFNISDAALKYSRELNLNFDCIKDYLVEDLLSKLPLLQNLALACLSGVTRLKISHYLLEKLHLCLGTDLMISFKPDEMTEVEVTPVPVIKHLRLEEFGVVCSTYEAMLDGLLWSCHPDMLEIPYTAEKNAEFIEVLREELIDRREDPQCCIDSRIRCWRHYIQDVSAQGLITAEDGNALQSSLPIYKKQPNINNKNSENKEEKEDQREEENPSNITTYLCLKPPPPPHTTGTLDKEVVLRRIRHRKRVNKVKSAVQALLSSPFASDHVDSNNKISSVPRIKWADDAFAAP